MKHYAPNYMLACKQNISQIKAILSQQLFCNPVKGNELVMDFENCTKSYSGHLHLRHNLWTKYHDLSSSGSWDILFTSFHWIIWEKTGDNLVMDLENFTKS